VGFRLFVLTMIDFWIEGVGRMAVLLKPGSGYGEDMDIEYFPEDGKGMETFDLLAPLLNICTYLNASFLIFRLTEERLKEPGLREKIESRTGLPVWRHMGITDYTSELLARNLGIKK